MNEVKILFPGLVTVAKSLTVKVPYCNACREHAAWFRDLGFFGKSVKTVFVALLGAGVWSLVFGFVGRNMLPSPEPLGLGRKLLMAVGCVAALVLGALYLGGQWRRRPGRLGAEHCTRRTAVKVLRFTKNEIRLGLRNEEFARVLEQLNSPSGPCQRP